MFWEDIDSAIFNDGNTQDIWNEIVRVSPSQEKLNTYKIEALNAPHEWQRTLMSWAVFVVQCNAAKDEALVEELNQCGQHVWEQFLKISKRESDATCEQWNPYKSF
tara:strand:- start:1210 stop:1527 length:318 start_codon:yes stop_codon:yes gene_type:complete